MKQFLIIPDINNLEACENLATSYHLGYEYNDFYKPDLLDDKTKTDAIIDTYLNHRKPDFCTMHGAFYDVIPFSADKQIQAVSNLRITQSLNQARQLNAQAVVFHTNYNPHLNHPEYISDWIDKNVRYWSQKLTEYSDINIYIENMFETSPELLVELSERLCEHKNYGICLDYSHATLTHVPASIWMEKLAKYIKHIHINDNDLVRDLHLAWGDGKIDRFKFYECYGRYTPDTPIVIETNSIQDIQHSLDTLLGDKFL